MRELFIGERVYVRLTPGQAFAGVTIAGQVIGKQHMSSTPPELGRYLFSFPLGSLVYIIQPTLWNDEPGDYSSIRLGEHDIEFVT